MGADAGVGDLTCTNYFTQSHDIDTAYQARINLKSHYLHTYVELSKPWYLPPDSKW